MIYISRDFAQEISDFEKLLAAFLLREAEICPFCEGWVTELLPVGRFVYALPCHHKITEGEIPDPWKPQKPEEGDPPYEV